MKNLVVIPVYKSTPDFAEIISFNQCIKILFKHPICIITYKELDISYYTDLLLKAKVEYRIEFFNKNYFGSLSEYNQLMLSKDFYERFKSYEYMLIYQLDAYVFRDELEYWCKQGYDYIGAPLPVSIKDNINKIHIKDFNLSLEQDFLLMNGGFSLRKTKSCLELTIQNSDSIQTYLNKAWYEDVIFCILLQQNKSKLPAEDIALKFSFESHPSVSFKKNNNQLPMGCHAWFRDDNHIYDKMFWFKRIIPLYYLKVRIKYLSFKIIDKNIRRFKRITNTF